MLKNSGSIMEQLAFAELSKHVQTEILASPLNISASFLLAAQRQDGITDDHIIAEIRHRNELDTIAKDLKKHSREILIEENIARHDFSPKGTKRFVQRSAKRFARRGITKIS